MAARTTADAVRSESLPPMPIDAETWQAVAAALELSPQQARIVELILRRMGDKQIAEAMGLAKSTVRDYLDRIFTRLGARGRVELILRVLSESQRLAGRDPSCPHQ